MRDLTGGWITKGHQTRRLNGTEQRTRESRVMNGGGFLVVYCGRINSLLVEEVNFNALK